MCKGLRGNSEVVHEHMFNVNVRINRLKASGVENVNEVSYSFIVLIKLALKMSFVQYHLKSNAHRPWFSQGGRVGSAQGLPVSIIGM